MKLTKFNIHFTLFLFIISILLWIKVIFDFANFPKPVKPSLILLMSLGLLTYAYFGIHIWYKNINKIDIKINNNINKSMWLFIPLSVICTSPVCYYKSIFIAPYLASSVIRISLLVFPIILFSIKNIKTEKGITVLIILAFVSLYPNDKCNNMFNYSWINWVGASPLTYLPTIISIVFYTFYFYGILSKKSCFVTLFIISISALTIALGHRIHLLW